MNQAMGISWQYEPNRGAIISVLYFSLFPRYENKMLEHAVLGGASYIQYIHLHLKEFNAPSRLYCVELETLVG